MKVLFVNHNKTRCGVYEFGRNIGQALKQSGRHVFLYRECGSESELLDLIRQETPAAIIYNYHPSTSPWVVPELTRKIRLPQLGMIHEVTQDIADRADNRLFNFHIAHDPTLLLRNPIVFKASRLCPPYENKFAPPDVTTVGSFGFGTGGKGFEKIVEAVQSEFDRAVIRFNIPFATFGDPDGDNARRIAEDCRRRLTKPGVELQISHEFLDQERVLDFLARNTVNVFLYEDVGVARGISSATDLALAVRRPVAVSHNSMFRHLLDADPSICVAEKSIKTIIENGTAPLEKYYREFSEAQLVWHYERIVDSALARAADFPIVSDNFLIKNLKRTKRYIKRRLGKAPVEDHNWISDTFVQSYKPGARKTFAYSPAEVPAGWSLNNILDDKARKIFEKTIAQMFEYLPELMSRKIPEANVQQAFVLDAVYRIASEIESPRILSVGSFEDSASESLKLLGFDVEEVDPMVNYDLATFMTKPGTTVGSYDVVFSTSVIEHVEDDERFLRHIARLLRKGGKAVLTCDYLDTYRPGDPKPAVDFRFYTQKDIKERLLPKVSALRPADEPQWDCPNPDFNYGGFNYTFATIVLEKIND